MNTQKIREDLSQNLKKYRKVKGWSQFELAEKAEISEQTVNSIEGLRLWPSDKTLSKLSDALEVEMYKLFVPQNIAFKAESVAELRQLAVKTVEEIISDTLRDFANGSQ